MLLKKTEGGEGRISVHSHPAASLSNYTVFRAGINVTPPDSKSFTVIGHACCVDQDRGLLSAQYELMERLHSHYQIVKDRKYFIKQRWTDHSSISEISTDEIAIGSTKSRNSDGSGFAYGSNLYSALSHAALELCERHLISMIWYELGSVCLLNERTLDLPKTNLKVYSLPFFLNNQLLIAALHDIERQIFVCGTALHLESAHAESHAIEEAIMLHDSLFRNDHPAYKSDANNEHFHSLVGDLSQARANKLQSQCVTQGHPTQATNLNQILDLLFGLENVYFSVLHEDQNSVVVKVYTSEVAKTPAAYRTLDQKISDPFC